MVDFKKIKELIRLVEESDITALAVEEEGMKVEIRREKGGVPMVQMPAAAAPPAGTVEEAGVIPVVSPMVGTFYRAPSPESSPFVDIGDEVKMGQTVCIVEAMKLFNEIEAEVEGTITKILVENGQPVEYGQKLFLVKKA